MPDDLTSISQESDNVENVENVKNVENVENGTPLTSGIIFQFSSLTINYNITKGSPRSLDCITPVTEPSSSMSDVEHSPPMMTRKRTREKITKEPQTAASPGVYTIMRGIYTICTFCHKFNNRFLFKSKKFIHFKYISRFV